MLQRFGKWILVLLALAGIYLAVQNSFLQDIVHPEKLTSFFRDLGLAGPFALMAMMTLAVVVSPIPSLPIDLAAGAVYGPFWGAVYVLIGAEGGAVLSFLIGRRLGRDFIKQWLKHDITFCEKCSDHHLFGLMVLARFVPVFSFDIVSYGAGLTNISLKSFAMATFLGMVPPTFAFTYLGSAVVSVQWPMILAGVLLVAIFLFLPKWIMSHRSSWWVGMLLGKPPEMAAQIDVQPKPNHCSWCGQSVKE